MSFVKTNYIVLGIKYMSVMHDLKSMKCTYIYFKFNHDSFRSPELKVQVSFSDH